MKEMDIELEYVQTPLRVVWQSAKSEASMSDDPIQKRTQEDKSQENYIELIPVDKDKREGEDYMLDLEMPLDKVAVDAYSEDISEQQLIFTDVDTVENHWQERQKLSRGGREELEEDLEQHHFTSPDMTGGDIDADWKGAHTGSGAEGVGGTEPTPDQDVVDELGQAVGITYDDGEPLNIEKKLKERRKKRLEPHKKQQDLRRFQDRDKNTQNQEQNSE